MTIVTLKLDNALQNFNFLVYCPKTRDCLVIDPLDVDQIIQTAKAQHLKITQILNTHEHGDHTGGNLALKKSTGATLMAHYQAGHLIPGFDKGLQAGNQVKVGEDISLTVLETPGHTPHSLCFHDKKNHAIFTGDTLFNCGCGNCHGGDPEVMFETFENQLQHLPDSTEIYPGHDYLRNNLNFAKNLQPDLPGIAALEQKLSPGEIYISTLGEDKTVDPFFRLNDSELISRISPATLSRQAVFLGLRKLRDKW